MLAASGPTGLSSVQGWLDSGKIDEGSTGTLALTANESSIDLTCGSTADYDVLRLGAIGAWTLSGTLTTPASTYYLGGGGGTLSVTGNLTDARGVDVGGGGGGTVSLSGTNTYTGNTTINSGLLSFASGALGSGGDIEFMGGALRWGSSNTDDISARVVVGEDCGAILDTNGNDVDCDTNFKTIGGGAWLEKLGDGTLDVGWSPDEAFPGDLVVTRGGVGLGVPVEGRALANGGSFSGTYAPRWWEVSIVAGPIDYDQGDCLTWTGLASYHLEVPQGKIWSTAATWQDAVAEAVEGSLKVRKPLENGYDDKVFTFPEAADPDNGFLVGEAGNDFDLTGEGLDSDTKVIVLKDDRGGEEDVDFYWVVFARALVGASGGSDIPVSTPACGCSDPGTSPKPVRYANGEIRMFGEDMGVGCPTCGSSDGTRSYDNTFAGQNDEGNGYGWQQKEQPRVVQSSGALVVMFDTRTSVWFAPDGDGTFTPKFGAKDALTHDAAAHLFTMTRSDGTVYRFHDFAQRTAPQGSFKEMVAPGGETLRATYNTGGQLTKLERRLADSTTVIEERDYTYISGGVNHGRLATIVLKELCPGAGMLGFRKVEYTYYGSEYYVNPATAYGLPGDLKTATTSYSNDGWGWGWSTWSQSSTYYYRYYTTDSATGFAHGLKRVVLPNAYSKLYLDTSGHPENAVEPGASGSVQIANYTCYYFEYDTHHQCTKEVLFGQSDEVQYEYVTRDEIGESSGYNVWRARTVETRANGDTYTVYTNFAGQVMLTDLEDAASSEHTLTYRYYDTGGRVLLEAEPSAVSDYETFATGDYAGCWDQSYDVTFTTDGLVHETTYYTADSAGETTPGGADGYVRYQFVRQAAEDPDPILQNVSDPQNLGTGQAVLSLHEYYKHTVGGQSIYPVASVTTYGDEFGDDPATTSYTYGWYTTSGHEFQAETIDVTLPEVDSSQNGSGVAAETRQWYNEHGQLAWSMDERGRVTYNAYDSATGRLSETIQDIDDATADGLSLTIPTGWTLPASGGANLATGYRYDNLGRTVQTLGPERMADVSGVPTRVRTASRTTYRDNQRETWTAQGYAEYNAGTQEWDDLTLVGPVSITKTDFDARVTEQIQALWEGDAADFLAGDDGELGDYVAWTVNKYSKTRPWKTAVYDVIPTGTSDPDSDGFVGTAGVNYDVSVQEYETHNQNLKGRPNKTVSPDGTITRTVLEARGNVLETWIGTDDSCATDSSPDGSDHAGTLHGNAIFASTVPGNLIDTGVYSLSLDGTGDYMSVDEANRAYDAATSLTVSLWIRLDDWESTATQYLFDSGSDGYRLSIDEGTLEWDVDGLIGGPLTAASDIVDTGWHHVVAQYDKAAAKLRLYVDGYQAGSDLAVTGTPDVGPDAELVIGADAAHTAALDGYVADLRIYRQVLTSAQVDNLADYGNPTLANFPKEVVHWNFSEGSGTTASGAPGNNMVMVSSSTYDADGNVTATTSYVDGNSANDRVTEFGYDWRDRLQFTILPADADGRVTYSMNHYDNLGRVVKTQSYWDVDEDLDTEGPEPLIDDQTPGDDTLLTQATTDYDALGRAYRTSTFAVDITDTDPLPGDALVSNTWYDASGNVIKSQAIDSATMTNAFTKTVYGGLGRPTAQYTGYDVDEEIGTSGAYAQAASLTGDTILQQVEYQYDPASSVIFVTARARKAGDTTTTGSLTNASGANEPRITYAGYWQDGVGRQIVAADYGSVAPTGGRPAVAPDTTNDDDALVAKTAYNDAGLAFETTDPAGHVTQATYDAAGRVTKTIANFSGNGVYDPDYPDENIDAAIEYTPGGNVWKQTDTLGNTTEYVYDGWGRLYQQIDPDPDGNPNTTGDVPITEYAYNYQGEVVTVTDPLGEDTTFEYDKLGRQVLATSPVPGTGQTAPSTATEYDVRGNVYSVADALDHGTTYLYDAWNRLETQTDANGEDTEYTYWDTGTLHTLTDPDGNTTTWVYDVLNRVVTETNQLDADREYTYSGGLLVQGVDRNGRVTRYDYDRFGRLEDEYWYANLAAAPSDPTANYSANLEYSYSYDAVSNLLTADGDDASYTYTPDALGRVTAISQTIAGLTPAVDFAQVYDGNGNRTQLAATIDSGADFVNDYQYDNLGRMKDLQQRSATGSSNVAPKAVHFAYTAASQLDAVTRYADTAETTLVATGAYTFDHAGRLIDIAYTGENSNNHLAGYHWTFDAGNRITNFYSLSDADSTPNLYDPTTWARAAYNYDNAGQLATVGSTLAAAYTNWTDAPDDEDYAYDPNGNREDGDYTVFATDGNNRMATGAGYTYQYDAEGNTVLRWVNHNSPGETSPQSGDEDITVYTWDHRNRLVKVEHFEDYDDYSANPPEPDRVVENSYDHANRWVAEKITDGSGTTQRRFVYDGNQIVLEFEKEGTGSLAAGDLAHRDLWSASVDQLLAQESVEGVTTAGDVLWTLTDNLNTVRDLAEYASGATSVAEHRIYNSFGQRTSPMLTDCIFGYTGRPTSEATGLQNNLNRWYEPITHRWLSQDPIGFRAGDGNLYRYLENDSTNAIDPTGTQLADISAISDPKPKFLGVNFSFGQEPVLGPGELAMNLNYTFSGDVLDKVVVQNVDTWMFIRRKTDNMALFAIKVEAIDLQFPALQSDLKTSGVPDLIRLDLPWEGLFRNWDFLCSAEMKTVARWRVLDSGQVKVVLKGSKKPVPYTPEIAKRPGGNGQVVTRGEILRRRRTTPSPSEWETWKPLEEQHGMGAHDLFDAVKLDTARALPLFSGGWEYTTTLKRDAKNPNRVHWTGELSFQGSNPGKARIRGSGTVTL